MGLKAEIKMLLQSGQEKELAERVAADPRAILPLTGRLWDSDETIRGRAARALGHASAAHPERGLEIVRRLMWALNDESATNGVYGIPALGEIGRRAPELIEPFVPALVSMSSDAGLRLALLDALAVMAESAPQRIAHHLEPLSRSVDRSRPAELQALERLVALTTESPDDR